MWLLRRINGRPFYRYSIGEKISYYQCRLNSSNPKIRENAIRNLYRLNRMANGNKTFGKVFMVKDKEFNPYANSLKSRRVVCVGFDNGKMKVVPVRKNKKVVWLSKFDGKRSINTNHIYDFSLNKIYEKRNFKNTSNDYLTLEEKLELQRKLNDNRYL